jgi:hypothetical protein
MSTSRHAATLSTHPVQGIKYWFRAGYRMATNEIQPQQKSVRWHDSIATLYSDRIKVSQTHLLDLVWCFGQILDGYVLTPQSRVWELKFFIITPCGALYRALRMTFLQEPVSHKLISRPASRSRSAAPTKPRQDVSWHQYSVLSNSEISANDKHLLRAYGGTPIHILPPCQ